MGAHTPRNNTLSPLADKDLGHVHLILWLLILGGVLDDDGQHDGHLGSLLRNLAQGLQSPLDGADAVNDAGDLGLPPSLDVVEDRRLDAGLGVVPHGGGPDALQVLVVFAASRDEDVGVPPVSEDLDGVDAHTAAPAPDEDGLVRSGRPPPTLRDRPGYLEVEVLSDGVERSHEIDGDGDGLLHAQGLGDPGGEVRGDRDVLLVVRL